MEIYWNKAYQAYLITKKRLEMNLTNEKFWWERPTFLKKNEEFVEKIVYVYLRAVVVGLCQTLHEKCESIT